MELERRLRLLLIGGAGGAFVAVRRRPLAPLPVLQAESQAPVDVVEAELQRLLVEERGVHDSVDQEPVLPPDRH
jgi:hypothetical protein